MALIDKLNDLGDAVRERSGLTEKMKLTEMAEVIRNIPYPVVEEITITENGTYTPEEGIDGFNQVVVDTHIPVVEEITITENGTYLAPVGVDGYSPVVVDIPEVICPDPVIEAIEIIENGVYDIPEGIDGYGPITVDIPEVVCPECPDPVLESLTITENGEYLPSTGIDGFNLVSVNVPTGGGGDLPDEAFNITGDCSYRFANGGWDWFIDAFANQIATNDITNCNYMFYYNTLKTIPFDINCKSGSIIDMSYMFDYANVRQAPRIINARPRALGFLFGSCYYLREIPDDFCDTWDWSYLNSLTYGGCSSMLGRCHSLRKVPTNILKNAYSANTSSYSSVYYSYFHSCYSLDEINDLVVVPITITSNFFDDTFKSCHRLKDMTFEVNEDGTPKTANWSNQVIGLSDYVGYANGTSSILNYNSGITADKRVIDDATYQALKDDPDWFTTDINYSRYNRISAVNTINSLPDTSAYGTNTIKFKGASGALTDGGAINTMTEEEIAVATAKGWTVSLV